MLQKKLIWNFNKFTCILYGRFFYLEPKINIFHAILLLLYTRMPLAWVWRNRIDSSCIVICRVVFRPPCFVLLHSRVLPTRGRPLSVDPSVRKTRCLRNHQANKRILFIHFKHFFSFLNFDLKLNENFKLWFLRFFFFFCLFVNMGLYGSKQFKRHLFWMHTTDSLPQSHAFS